MGKVTVIAEIGSSPAPAWDFAPWCAAAANAGADAVKVQLFRASHFPAAEWDSKRPLEFPRNKWPDFVSTAHAYGLSAGASVFDEGAVRLVAMYSDFLKLAAREQDNEALFFACLATGKQVYRSVSDLDQASSLRGQTTLYAMQQYPAPMWEALAWVIRFKRSMNGVRWGWSSHTTGYLDCWLAARLGASVIEKHLCLSPTDLEAGHSLQPAKFAAMCRAIRR